MAPTTSLGGVGANGRDVRRKAGCVFFVCVWLALELLLLSCHGPDMAFQV